MKPNWPPDGFWVEPLEFPKNDGKLHPKWIQEHAWDAWKNSNHGGKDWEQLPTLPACISFWNSYKFWNNIPQNNNRKGRKKTTTTKKKTTQPTLPKEKKIPKKFRFAVSGNVGKAQNSRDEKEPRWILSLSNCKVWKLPTVPKSDSNQNPRKKVGISRSNSHLPAKVWAAADP